MQPFHKSGGKEVHLHGTFTCRSSAQISEKWINYKRTAISNKSKKKGIEVGNHMSTIGENEERQVRAAFAPKKAPVEKKAAAFKAEKPAKEHKRESEKVGKKPSDKRSTEKKQAVRPDQGKTNRDQKSVNRTNERHSGNHMDKNKNNNNRRSNQREGQSNDRFGGNDNKKGKFNKKKNHPERMEVRKYCRFCKKHTLHKETK